MIYGSASWRFIWFHSQRHLQPFSRFSRAQYCFPCIPSSLLLFSFSTLDLPSNTLNDGSVLNETKNQSNIDEHHVLQELSDLLPFTHNSSAPIPSLFRENFAEKRASIRGIDGFLLPEEKLRGVFLQKLKGKTAIENALAIASVDLSLDVVDKVLNRGGLGGEAMVIFFNWAIKQPSISKDVSTYHIILKALGRRKFFKFMVEILNDMMSEEVIANVDTISIVIDSFVTAHRVSKALQMFGNLEEIFGLKCDTQSLNVVLQCMCKRSHVGAANSFMNSMKGKIAFDSMTYNIMIGGWSRYGRVSEIERIMKEMEEDGFFPDCLTFTYLLEGLGRAGLVDDAVGIFGKMKEKGCIPDVGAYNAIISNFISIGDFDESMKYYKHMLSNQCDPNSDTYAKLIVGLLKNRRVADALELFDEMLERGIIPTTGTITSFIELLCGYGPPHAAMMIYKKARKVGCRISESAHKLLLMRLSRFGKCGMLLNIWDDMQECGYSLDVKAYEYVIDGLCNNQQLENAVLVMEECLHRGFCPSRLICSKLNNKLLASEKVHLAYKLFLKIKDARHRENLRRNWRANGWHF